MSGRRTKKLRKLTAGALVACSALGTRYAVAQSSSGTAGDGGTRSTAQLPLRQFDIAPGTLAEAWRAKRLNIDELQRIATRLRVQRVMQPYLEAIVL